MLSEVDIRKLGVRNGDSSLVNAKARHCCDYPRAQEGGRRQAGSGVITCKTTEVLGEGSSENG